MQIKNPTIRKVRRRGFTPVAVRTKNGVYNGWITKRGRKWIHIQLIDRKIKVAIEEEEKCIRNL